MPLSEILFTPLTLTHLSRCDSTLVPWTLGS